MPACERRYSTLPWSRFTTRCTMHWLRRKAMCVPGELVRANARAGPRDAGAGRESDAMVEQRVVDSIQEYMRRLGSQDIEVSFAVVFGSQARGDGDEWSDIDLLVVSPRFDDSIDRDDVRRLWRVAARTDSRIEPVPCGAREWVEDTAAAVIEIARREGVRIPPAA